MEVKMTTFKELNEKEMLEVEGGGIIRTVGNFVIACLAYIFTNM